MINYIKNSYSKIFMICYFLFLIFLMFINLYNPSMIIIIGAFLAIGLFILLRKLKIEKTWLFIIFLILPILLRISLLFLNYGILQSDYEFFYTNALAFSKSLTLNNSYIALFPYLHLYIVVLGSVFKILGSKYFIVVLVNIIFEFIGGLFLYKIAKDKSYNKKINIIIFI